MIGLFTFNLLGCVTAFWWGLRFLFFLGWVGLFWCLVYDTWLVGGWLRGADLLR